MNTPRRCIQTVLTASLASLCLAQPSWAAGLMTPASSALPALRMQQHHVQVVIEDGYAITAVEQTFFNPNAEALEAIYSFPVPDKAAVGEFTYWIDGKPVTGEVLPRQQARDIYTQEKSQGRETALTEKNAYRSFETQVYPVAANGSVRIRLVYIQPVHSDTGIGRYIYPLEEGGVDEQREAFWHYNTQVDEAFSFEVDMRSSYPIDEFRLPQHPGAAITSTDSHHWQVALQNAEAEQHDDEAALNGDTDSAASPVALDRDIVVYWRHQPNLPGAVDLVTYKKGDVGTFMMTLTPGDDLNAVPTGRDWVFVLDYSGSMQGKYQSLIEGVRRGLHRLHPSDRFRVVLFNDNSQDITRGYVPVDTQHIEATIRRLESIGPSGGTNLYSGLKSAYRKLDADRPSAVLLVTDGVANVGVTEKKQFLNLLEQHDVRLFSFVMGNSANRPLLQGMSDVSHGFYMNISNADDIPGRLMQAAEKLNHEAYRDIDITINGVKTADLTPARLASLYRGEQLIVFGHYWGSGEADITITGKTAADTLSYKAQFEFPKRSTRNPELERLWAYASIEDWQNEMDYLGHNPDTEQAIVDTAVAYGLVTDYTSLLVVRESVFEQLGIARDNAARVAIEQQAQAQRSAATQSTSQQHALNSPRAYPKSGGAGAMHPLALLLVLPLLYQRLRNNRRA